MHSVHRINEEADPTRRLCVKPSRHSRTEAKKPTPPGGFQQRRHRRGYTQQAKIESDPPGGFTCQDTIAASSPKQQNHEALLPTRCKAVAVTRYCRPTRLPSLSGRTSIPRLRSTPCLRRHLFQLPSASPAPLRIEGGAALVRALLVPLLPLAADACRRRWPP